MVDIGAGLLPSTLAAEAPPGAAEARDNLAGIANDRGWRVSRQSVRGASRPILSV